MVPPELCVAEMINTGKYMVAPTVLMNASGQMRAEAAERYWRIVMGGVATDVDIEAIIYTQPASPSTSRWTASSTATARSTST